MPAGWVSAGIAAIGVGENISANQSASSAANKNNQTAAQLGGAQGSMLNQAEAVAQQPFTPYTGTLTAPMSGNEQQGYSLASSTATNGVAQGDNTAATGLLGQVASTPWNANTAATYMNPYTQDVTNSAIANANKSYLQNLAGLNTNEAGSDAFGGSRSAIAQADLASNESLNIGSLTATGNANAYDNAMKAWEADNNTKIATANAYEQAGQDVTNMTSQQISDLMKTGGVSQVIAQTDLANQYGQFLRQQGWSAQQLQSLIGAVGTAKGSPAQTAPVQSNTANQLLGLGSTIAGLFGGGSSSAGETPTVGNSAPSADLTNSIPITNFSPDTSNVLGGLGYGGGG